MLRFFGTPGIIYLSEYHRKAPIPIIDKVIIQVHDCGDLQMVHKNQRELVWVIMVLIVYQSLGNTVA